MIAVPPALLLMFLLSVLAGFLYWKGKYTAYMDPNRPTVSDDLARDLPPIGPPEPGVWRMLTGTASGDALLGSIAGFCLPLLLFGVSFPLLRSLFFSSGIGWLWAGLVAILIIALGVFVVDKLHEKMPVFGGAFAAAARIALWLPPLLVGIALYIMSRMGIPILR